MFCFYNNKRMLVKQIQLVCCEKSTNKNIFNSKFQIECQGFSFKIDNTVIDGDHQGLRNRFHHHIDRVSI